MPTLMEATRASGRTARPNWVDSSWTRFSAARRSRKGPDVGSTASTMLSATPGKRLVIPRSSSSGVSGIGSKPRGAGPAPAPLDGCLLERRRRVDLAADQLRLRRFDGVLDFLRNDVGVRREQLGIGELLDSEEAVRSTLEGPV